MLNFKIQSPSIKQAIDEAAKPLKRAGDRKKLLELIGNVVVQRVRLSFRLGKSPYGVPWKPLRFRDGTPLVDTGALSMGINYKVVSRNEVEIGSPEKWAWVHQYGATIKAKPGGFLMFQPKGYAHPIFAKQVTIPARPFLPTEYLPEAYERDIKTAIQNFVGASNAR